ncbi:Poly(U)-binding-splicing factor PUF60 [Echinococcus granulosus]|uniref:Poly(U)-binding-splicing factor PUF60 n=1 Tax=Echinococcus granulosus TaxID=6210 RepID=W6U542_ECHGR|nr:Poly(U)-binding-splicing factor PUF60 [Echinococcus granulosus]EUB56293.1 Poly(U)-binding-splicing factor PUF60 [Echinococcus granulosus]KAH9285314.1 Poly(U)-binding-splicing factor PUF60 [Echinococcus granulosus]
MITGLPVEDVIIEAYGPVFNGPGAEKRDIPFVLRKLEGSQQDAIERAKKYAMEQNVKIVLLKQTQQSQSLQMNAARRNQTLALLNRIYIGSIAYDIKEEMIKQAFLPFGPVKNVSMSWDPVTQKHKGFAFVEFEYPEAAQLAIEQMNGSNFGGRLLKVGRPSNLPDAAPFMAELIHDYKLQSRIYVSGVHLDLSDSDIALVFEAFGKITMCRLAPDPHRPGFHRGFGYVEFESEQAATAAVMSMNRFDLGGQLLRVTKAISPPDGINTNPVISQLPAATAVAAASVTAKLLSMDVEQLPDARPPTEVAATTTISGASRSSRDRLRSRSRSPRSSRHLRHSRRRRRSSSSATTSSSRHRRQRRRSHESRSRHTRRPSPLASASAEKSKQEESSLDEEKVKDGTMREGEFELKVGSDEAKSQSLTVPNNSNWSCVSLEEEQATSFVRSNDSRLYNIASPSTIPLPPSN